ncbi:MAG: hypothetical protein ABEJ65_03475 [bacterium]
MTYGLFVTLLATTSFLILLGSIGLFSYAMGTDTDKKYTITGNTLDEETIQKRKQASEKTASVLRDWVAQNGAEECTLDDAMQDLEELPPRDDRDRQEIVDSLRQLYEDQGMKEFQWDTEGVSFSIYFYPFKESVEYEYNYEGDTQREERTQDLQVDFLVSLPEGFEPESKRKHYLYRMEHVQLYGFDTLRLKEYDQLRETEQNRGTKPLDFSREDETRIKTGVPDLDERYLVFSEYPEEGQSYFNNEQRITLIEKLHQHNNSHLSYSLHGTISARFINMDKNWASVRKFENIRERLKQLAHHPLREPRDEIDSTKSKTPDVTPPSTAPPTQKPPGHQSTS